MYFLRVLINKSLGRQISSTAKSTRSQNPIKYYSSVVLITWWYLFGITNVCIMPADQDLPGQLPIPPTCFTPDIIQAKEEFLNRVRAEVISLMQTYTMSLKTNTISIENYGGIKTTNLSELLANKEP